MSTLFLAGVDWLWPALAAAAIALFLVLWSYLRTPAPRVLRLACAGLKLLGLLALLACLLEPMWSSERAKPGANVLAIIADNSQSLTLRNAGKTEPRAEALRRAVSGEHSRWRTGLEENFEVRNYLADSRLQSTPAFAELDFTGRTSALGNALKLVAERHRGQALAGVVLLTDGIAGDLSEASDLAGLPPIYPVVFGEDQPTRDIAIASTATTLSSFEDAPLAVQAEIAAPGFRGSEVQARMTLIEPDQAEERVVAEQKLRVPEGSDQLAFRFQVRPEKAGVLFYRIRAEAGDPALEATAANNETIVAVDRGRGPHRVLYVSGRPNWEYKFLSRAVTADDQTQLVGLIRIAKREAKFEFRGRSGESSNPLFRGFGNQSKEEIERYDQPVLVRLNTEDQFELMSGFPKTAEELFRYEALIIDDLEAAFFTADQMSLVQRFVSERGGSLLMLSGAESLREGQYQRTAIGDLLPVYLDADPAPLLTGPLRLALTREGWLQPWARLRANEADEQARLAELPPFDVLSRVGAPKPAAVTVASVTDGERTLPALVTQRFGRGRTAAFLIGDFWQAGLADEARSADLGRAWRQLVRWLVADVPGRVEVRLEPHPAQQAMRIEVRARDAKFQPLDNATVTVQVQPIGHARAKQPAAENSDATPDTPTPPIELTLEPSATEAGLFETTYLPRETGGYRVDATVKDEQGRAAGTAEAGWSTDLAAAEFRSLTPNRPLMEWLARTTGGRILTPSDLEAFARDLPKERVPVTERFTRPLWHTPAMFIFALGCFVGEWGLRRWKGLA